MLYSLWCGALTFFNPLYLTRSAPDIFDVIVIGGGPAGMMAAARAAERGRRVLLLEKNQNLGKKLRITGGGRCNLTNNQPSLHSLAAKYKGSGRFLFSAFSQFGVADTLNFFNAHGVPAKEEADGRMFPVSNSAESVCQALVANLKVSGVTVRTASPVSTVNKTDRNLFAVTLKDKSVIQSHSCIIAVGGLSHPETGSTGDGFAWLKHLGHTIADTNFSLVPITVKDAWVKRAAGITLSDIKLTIMTDGKKYLSKPGRVLFTHVGVSGPTILNLSKDIGDLLPYHTVALHLDLFPALDYPALKQQVQTLLIENSNQKVKNTLKQLIAPGLVPIVLDLVGINGDSFNHSVRHAERAALIKLLKAIPLQVKGLLGADKAVISSGGVALTEVDFKTMSSRRVANLYLVGDILDIDRPSGGYSLQLCWTTGFVAGNNA